MKNRSTLPALCLATPQDKAGTKWTKNTPTEFILDRLVVLAKASLRTIEQQIMSGTPGVDFKVGSCSWLTSKFMIEFGLPSGLFSYLFIQ